MSSPRAATAEDKAKREAEQKATRKVSAAGFGLDDDNEDSGSTSGFDEPFDAY